MNFKEYYIILQTILIGLTILLYIKKWGELIQVRSYAIYITVPLLWSCVFLLLLFKLAPVQIELDKQSLLWASIGIVACYYWIGMLCFPVVEQLERHSQFAYLDYYEHFRKQIPWLMALVLFSFLLKFWTLWSVKFPSLGFIESLSFFLYFKYNFLIIGTLALAFFSEHKGLVCFLAWFILSLLIFV